MFSDGQLYIDGQLRPASGNARYEVTGPWTGEVIGYGADAGEADVEEAIAAARRAFDETDWPANPALRREVLLKFADRLQANRDGFVELTRVEGGAAKFVAELVQVDRTIENFRDLINFYDTVEMEVDKGRGSIMGMESDLIVRHEPIGVVGAIAPWNMPFPTAISKLAPALLVGCSVIVKGDPNTPLINSLLGQAANEAGMPRGVLNVLTGKDPAFLGERLVTDPRVDLISFTGSTVVGRRIMEKAAPRLKRVFFELGGKSANIILDDVPDFTAAVSASIVCLHAGQVCAAATRLLVPRSRYDEAVAILEQTYAGYSQMWGGFDDPGNVMGPLISARQRDRVLGYIELGKEEGARLLAGGNAVTDKGDGFFVEPTCFVDVTNDMRIAREEIFGPVLVVIPYEDDDDAVRIANDSDYGLAGGIEAGDRDRALDIARRIRTGALSVNGGMPFMASMPFGGYKQSGIGRESGVEGFLEYMETKSIGVGVR